MEIEQSVNNTTENFYSKICHSGKEKNSSIELYMKSDVIFHKFGKKFHIQWYFKFNKNDYDVDSSKKPTREFSTWFTKNRIVSNE